MLNDEEKSTGYEGSTSSYEFDEEFEMLVKAYMRDMNYTSLNQVALNVVYSLMNAGLVALPFARSHQNGQREASSHLRRFSALCLRSKRGFPC
jgi:hypothetical protein